MNLDIKNLKEYKFTRHWFRRRNMQTFIDKVHPMFAGKPIVYLELGVFEGMSMVWVLQHILTHSQSRAVGIDPWLMSEKFSHEDMQSVKSRAHLNVVTQTAHPNRAFSADGFPKELLIQANSAEILRRMVRKSGFGGISKSTVDLSLVDGNHNALAVWDDARLVLQLLKPGGVMMFDDVENDVPKKDHVKEGVELFLQEAKDAVKFLWKDRHMEAYVKQ